MANFPFNDDGTLASTIAEHGARVPTQAALDALDALLDPDGGGGAACVISATDPGAIGAGNLWLQTNTGYSTQQLWVRNDADDGWLIAAAGVSDQPATVMLIGDPDTDSLQVGLQLDDASAQFTYVPASGDTDAHIDVSATSTQMVWSGNAFREIHLDDSGIQLVGDLGFYGATPVAQPAAPVTLADVIAALQALGLVAS
jgi:hypothetical protein